jgi:Fic family protein
MNVLVFKLAQRIREEFDEAPGLRLTSDQAARFWGLDSQTCETVLAELSATGFLQKSADGRYQKG